MIKINKRQDIEKMLKIKTKNINLKQKLNIYS